MKITKSQLKKIIKEELDHLLNEREGPRLEYHEDSESVVLVTGDGEFYMTPDELRAMKSPEWDDDVIEIETADMGGKSVDLPKEVVKNFIDNLK